MKNKFILTLVVGVLLSLVSVGVSANETVDIFSLDISTNQPEIGSEFDIEVLLKDYENSVKKIAGVQVDIDNFDSNIFEIVSQSPLIVSDSAVSNEINFLQEENKIRYLYINFDNTLDTTQSKLMAVKLKVKDNVSVNSTELLVTLKIQYEGEETASQSLVQEIVFSTSNNDANNTSPDTGDNSNFITLIAITLTSLLMLIALIMYKLRMAK